MTPARLAIIPARGGSKELPGKNLATVAGETLTARAVRCACDSGLFHTILVSTDDEAIARAGQAAGAAVPFLRPQDLAGDGSNILDAVLDALHRLEGETRPRFETVALIEPTSPLRTPATVRETVTMAEQPGVDSAFTVSLVPLKFHSRKQFIMTAEGLAVHAHPGGLSVVNRQELAPTFIRNGLCYAAKRAALERGLGFTNGRAGLVVTDGPVVNIDGPDDLEAARRILGP